MANDGFYNRERSRKETGTFTVNVTCCLPVTRYRNGAIKLVPTWAAFVILSLGIEIAQEIKTGAGVTGEVFWVLFVCLFLI